MNLIAPGRLTFDKRFELHCVDPWIPRVTKGSSTSRIVNFWRSVYRDGLIDKPRMVYRVGLIDQLRVRAHTVGYEGFVSLKLGR